MADATVDRPDNSAKHQTGDLVAMAMSNVKLLKNTLLSINTLGYVKKGSDTASEVFAGVAYEQVDNSGGSAGDKKIRVRKHGVYSFAFSSGDAAQTAVGQEACIVDNQSVNLAAVTTNDVKCGKIVEVISVSEVRVRIDGYAA